MKRIIPPLHITGLLVMIVLTASGYTHHQRYLETYIEGLEVGEPIHYENMVIAPVYSRSYKGFTHYATLDEALDRGWLEITELDRGEVSKVKISNHSDQHIFIMGGEILAGGKQDRIIGKDVLIGPQSRHVIVPVYCTEEGRWQSHTKNFYSKKNLGTWNLRSTAQYAEYGAQASIWADITETNRSMGVHSKSKAYQKIYDDSGIQRRIARYEDKLRYIPNLRPDTIGVIVAVGGDIVSVDLFTSPEIFRSLWPKILKSSALTAIHQRRYDQVDVQDFINFLRQVHDADYFQKNAIDLGIELISKGRNINANALLYRNQVVHIAAFPLARKRIYFKSYQETGQRYPVYQQLQTDQ